MVSSLSLASSSSSSCFTSSTTFPFSPGGGGENECDLLLLLERERDLKRLARVGKCKEQDEKFVWKYNILLRKSELTITSDPLF